MFILSDDGIFGLSAGCADFVCSLLLSQWIRQGSQDVFLYFVTCCNKHLLSSAVATSVQVPLNCVWLLRWKMPENPTPSDR